MSKNIVIDKESFTRTKKKLKKNLESKGVSFTLSEVSDILAQSLGFKNEFDMQKKCFEKSDDSLKEDHFLGSVEDMLKNIKKPSDIKSYDIENHNILERILSSKSKLKGNIIIYGKSGAGKTTLVDFIYNKLSNLKLKTLECYIDENTFNSENDLRKHNIVFGNTKYGMSLPPNKKEINNKSDVEKILKINNEGYHVVCDMYATDENDVYKRLEYLGGKNLNIHYLIDVHFIKNKQHIIVHNLIDNEVYRLSEYEKLRPYAPKQQGWIDLIFKDKK